VRLVGRLAGLRNETLQFSGSLRNQCALSDLKMNRLLDRFDSWATTSGIGPSVGPARRFEPTRVPAAPLELSLASGEIRSILWATGFRPDYRWLDVPILDYKGRVQHDGGITPAPGLYLVGMPFLRRRKSTLIDGAADDARDIAAHIAAYLRGHTAGAGPLQAAS
jgi:putative flavoprotein involved in K+ transport